MKAWILVAALAAGGCVSPDIPPEPRTVESSREFAATFDQTWIAVVDVLAKWGTPVRSMERDSGFISLGEMSYGPGQADEGTLSMTTKVVKRNIRGSITIRQSEGPTTTVALNFHFEHLVLSGGSPDPVWRAVVSTGAAEQQFLAAVGEQLAPRVDPLPPVPPAPAFPPAK